MKKILPLLTVTGLLIFPVSHASQFQVNYASLFQYSGTTIENACKNVCRQRADGSWFCVWTCDD